MLRLNHASISVEGKRIISDFSFGFEEGKTYVIMGPNGSGKSTLAYAIMGHPVYEVSGRKSQKKPPVSFNGIDLSDLDAQKRSEAGIFLSFQSPLALSGVTVFQLLHVALSGKRDPLTVRKEIVKYAKLLKIPDELLARSLNEGASGGERKKLEVLQAAVLDKPVQIFDEIDTGVDVDALRTIATFLKSHQKNKTYIIITHYNRILRYLKPDKVLVLEKGTLKKTGNYQLAQKIEKSGYASVSR